MWYELCQRHPISVGVAEEGKRADQSQNISFSSSRSGKIFKSCENILHALIVSLLFLTRYSENTQSPRS